MHGHLQSEHTAHVLAVLLNVSGQSELCNLTLHCTLLSPSILSVTVDWEEQRRWQRGFSKSAFCEIVGGP